MKDLSEVRMTSSQSKQRVLDQLLAESSGPKRLNVSNNLSEREYLTAPEDLLRHVNVTTPGL